MFGAYRIQKEEREHTHTESTQREISTHTVPLQKPVHKDGIKKSIKEEIQTLTKGIENEAEIDK